MHVKTESINVTWSEKHPAVGGFLRSEENRDYYGTVVVTTDIDKIEFPDVPVLSFVNAVSWAISTVLFTGKKQAIEIPEYPPLLTIEQITGEDVFINDGKTMLAFNLAAFCKSVGQAEAEILLHFLNKPSDLSERKVELQFHFVGSEVFSSYKKRGS